MVGMRKLSFSCDEHPFVDCAIPSVPIDGVRIRICYAGLCYVPTMSTSPLRKGGAGFRNGNIFEGFEVSGIVESIGDEVVTHDLTVGDHVVVFPDDDVVRQGYADFVIVRKLTNIVKLPTSISLAVGAMLPTGGTLAMSAVIQCQKHLESLISQKGECNILIIGSGALTHWLIRLLRHTNKDMGDVIHMTVASDDWAGLNWSKKLGAKEVILLNENCHEEVLIETIQKSLKKDVEISVCLTQNERSQKRAVQCLKVGGVLLLPQSFGFGECFLVKEKNLQTVHVPPGTVEVLRTLVTIIDQSESLQENQPAYKVYPVESSQKVYEDLQLSVSSERPLLAFEAGDGVV